MSLKRMGPKLIKIHFELKKNEANMFEKNHLIDSTLDNNFCKICMFCL